MRREVLVAIILGVGLGILVAFGVWRANIALSDKTPQAQTSDKNSKSQEEAVFSNLVITQPEDLSVVSVDTILVKGSSSPKSTVVVLSDGQQEVYPAREDGNFESQIKLEAGINEIVVISVDETGNEEEQKLNIVYSTEFTDN